ncbi:unnamed protein product, partial [Oikopleura dioica]
KAAMSFGVFSSIHISRRKLSVSGDKICLNLTSTMYSSASVLSVICSAIDLIFDKNNSNFSFGSLASFSSFSL